MIEALQKTVFETRPLRLGASAYIDMLQSFMTFNYEKWRAIYPIGNGSYFNFFQ